MQPINSHPLEWNPAMVCTKPLTRIKKQWSWRRCCYAVFNACRQYAALTACIAVQRAPHVTPPTNDAITMVYSFHGLRNLDLLQWPQLLPCWCALTRSAPAQLMPSAVLFNQDLAAVLSARSVLTQFRIVNQFRSNSKKPQGNPCFFGWCEVFSFFFLVWFLTSKLLWSSSFL